MRTWVLVCVEWKMRFFFRSIRHTALAMLVFQAIGFAQQKDISKLSAELNDSIQEIDVAAAKRAISRLADLDSSDAANALYKATTKCHEVFVALKKKKGENKEDPDDSGLGDLEKQFEKALGGKLGLPGLGDEEDQLCRIRDAIIEGIAKCKNKAAVGITIKKLEDSSPRIRTIAAIVAGLIGSSETIDALWKSLKREKEPLVQVAVIYGLTKPGIGGYEYDAQIAPFLKSPYIQVRRAALRWFRVNGSREGVEFLIEALKDAPEDTRCDIVRTLEQLTGISKGEEYSSWKGWWEINKKEFIENTYKPKPDEISKNPQTGAIFFGIPVRSDHVTFILDRSGSMIELATFKYIVETKGAGEIPGIKLEGNRKIDIAKYELKKTIYQMKQGTMFNVAFYNQGYTFWKENLQKLDDSSRKSAFEFIDSVEPIGATNIYDPVEKAMKSDKKGDLPDTIETGKLKKDACDTIFLLSDGLPNFGAFSEPADILREIRRLNLYREIVINTVFIENPTSLEYSEGASFMKKLAEIAGGTFVEVCNR